MAPSGWLPPQFEFSSCAGALAQVAGPECRFVTSRPPTRQGQKWKPLKQRSGSTFQRLYNDAMGREQTVSELLHSLRATLPELQARYSVQDVALFGSYVRGANRPGSDLDVLVTFREPPSLLHFLELENTLADQLGVPVDLVMRDSLKPRLGQRILEEAVPV